MKRSMPAILIDGEADLRRAAERIVSSHGKDSRYPSARSVLLLISDFHLTSGVDNRLNCPDLHRSLTQGIESLLESDGGDIWMICNGFRHDSATVAASAAMKIVRNSGRSCGFHNSTRSNCLRDGSQLLRSRLVGVINVESDVEQSAIVAEADDGCTDLIVLNDRSSTKAGEGVDRNHRLLSEFGRHMAGVRTMDGVDRRLLIGCFLGSTIASVRSFLKLISDGHPTIVFNGASEASELIGTILRHDDRSASRRRCVAIVEQHLTSISVRFNEQVPHGLASSLIDAVIGNRRKIRCVALENDELDGLRKHLAACVAAVIEDGDSITGSVDDVRCFHLGTPSTISTTRNGDLNAGNIDGENGSDPNGHSRWMENLWQLLIDLNAPDELRRLSYALRSVIDRDFLYRQVEKATMRDGNEWLVELLIERGLRVEQFLTPDRLIRLLRRDGDEIGGAFRVVILGHYLDRGAASGDDERRLAAELPWLLESLCGCSMSSLRFDGNDRRRSYDRLVFWALLTGRCKLAQCFWSFSFDPLPLALVCARLCKRLSSIAHDWPVFEENWRRSAVEFDRLANDLLTIAYQRAPIVCYDALSIGVEDFGGLTPMQLASLAENYCFLSQDVCYRWIERLWYGGLTISRGSGWSSFLPNWLKILSSAVFVVPIHWWVRLSPVAVDCAGCRTADVLLPSNASLKNVQSVWRFSNLMSQGDIDELDGVGKKSQTHRLEVVAGEESGRLLDTVVVTPRPTLLQTVRAFYGMPTVKFWLHLTFRLVFLLLLGVTLAQPTCGERYLDLAVCCWAFFDWTQRVWMWRNRRRSKLYVGAFRQLCDVLATFCLLAAVIALKLVPSWICFSETAAFTGRAAMAIYVLYICYETLLTFIPRSRTLGPFLVRIRLMVGRDLVKFFILTALFISSFSVVIHAVIYPDYPTGAELWRRALYRAWSTLFLTPMSDLESEKRCEELELTTKLLFTPSVAPGLTCCSPEYSDPTCPKSSFVSYAVVFQFLILLKLVGIPILYSLFNRTSKEIEESADGIWKQQFFQLASEFAHRPLLPPPLTWLAMLFTVCCGRKMSSKRDSDQPDTARQTSVVGGLTGDRQPDESFYSCWNTWARHLYKSRSTNTGLVEGTPKQLAKIDGKLSELQAQLSEFNARLEELHDLVRR